MHNVCGANLVNSKLRRQDINSKVKTRPGIGSFQMFLLTGRFVSWETAKVLNYALYEEAISGLGDFPPTHIYATGHNK